MDSGRPSPFTELYTSTQAARSNPKIVPGVPLSAWKTDERALRCGICLKRFNVLRWKHHCRVCGDVCCRRCLGFSLVDVPMVGVDLAFTCARCIRHVNCRPVTFTDDNALDAILSAPSAISPSSCACSSPRSLPASPRVTSRSLPSSPRPTPPSPSFAAALTPASPSPSSSSDYRVIVSQYHSAKLHSVCAMVSDYLECAGAAIALISDSHVWVVAHKGLRTSALHSDTYLALCRRAIESNTTFTRTTPRKTADNEFRFAAVAPLNLGKSTSRVSSPLGCVVALDTRPRTDTAANKVQRTLETLARLVLDQLTEDATLLRIYATGDFKIFASNAMDLAPATQTLFDRIGVNTPKASGKQRHKRSTAESGSSSMLRSRSFGGQADLDDEFDIVAQSVTSKSRKQANTAADTAKAEHRRANAKIRTHSDLGATATSSTAA